MLPRIPEESRTEFVEKTVACLVSVGGADLSAEAFEAFKEKLTGLVREAKQSGEPTDKGGVKNPRSKG